MLQPDDLDLAGFAGTVEVRFPDLAPAAPCSVLDHGFGSIVIETASGAVFRIGRDSRSYTGYELERQLLPAIAPLLPVRVPSPRWFVAPNHDFPGGAIGYPKLPGRRLSLELFETIDRAALAEAIAALVAALHRIDLADAAYVPKAGPHERRASDIELRDVVLPVLRKHLGVDECVRLEEWWRSYLADPLMMEFDCVVTHGDLWYGNLLVDNDGHLAAVLDWEIARIGDPARDFAGLKYLGVPFIDDVLRRYEALGGAVSRELRARIEKIIVIREFYGVLWSIPGRDDQELAESIEKIRGSAIFATAAG